MNSIELDDEVLAELARRVVGFNVTPNDVIRQVLGLSNVAKKPAPIAQAGTSLLSKTTPAPTEDGNNIGHTLRDLTATPSFQRQGQTINRFLLLLWWAHVQNPAGFSKAAMDYQRGNRRYFGRSQTEVESSGVGIKAKEIPKTSIWVLATLDNKAKRTIIEDLFRSLGHSLADVNLAKEQLADTNIKRRRTFDLSILD